jgi:short-subunit dehydrogenase
MKDLAGKRVLITGAARGIGRAIAVRLARERAEVVLTDLDPEALPAAAEAVRAAGGEVRTYVLDVADVDGIEAFRERLREEAGPVDVLVNNAGLVFGGALLDLPWERHLLTYRVNLLGLVAVTRAFLPDLIARPRAHLVNVASASGLIGLPYGSTYASSKWGVIGFSESVRLELRELGHRHVGVSVICPSYVATGLFDGARPPFTTRMLTPERVADLTVRAVLRNRVWVLAPWLVKITPAATALLPSWLGDRVSRWLGVTSGMAGWRGHDGPR